ncbi:hypothetical protein NEDG_00704 [Nematocida displodere]|uniref:Activating signal cointegrator complex subunit 3 n=1 Tax=Nematocida displodere TaxID=1805483 RepID=A0A177EDI2_9MICR|nr:hypothetical protein NEDG_00704 [Nematocida displodere]
MEDISARLSKKLDVTNEESKTMIKTALKSTNPEEELFDLFGEDGVDDVIAILAQSAQSACKPPSTKPCLISIEASIDQILAPKLLRYSTELYDEYVLEGAACDKEVVLVPTTAVSEAFRGVFKEYSYFNKVQSLVFKSIYESSENVLVSAPTGAGKTDVALLAMVRHLETSPGTKIVYIAPMKALAGEVTQKLVKKLPVLVREHTGDTELTREEVRETAVLVCTPEKFDISTRKISSALLQQVGLVILDEVHILNDSRGPVIEGLVARLKVTTASLQRRTRMLGISATLPNARDVADFLQVPPAHLHLFSREYRPVPLTCSVIGTRKAVDIAAKEGLKRADTKEKMLWVLQMKIDALMEAGHQAIIFVHTRGDTLALASYLSESFVPDLAPESLPGPELPEALRDIYARGVFIHHAGLPRGVRDLGERAFRDRRLRVLVSTSTLAWGVNLPARAVIIFGTQYYSPETGRHEDVSPLDVQQMFGRAGRPQYDTEAQGILITSHKSLQKYVRMLRAEDPIESSLLKTLPERVCAEIYLKNIRSYHEGIAWVKSTFLWQRMGKAPERYGTIYQEKEFAVNDYIHLTFSRLQALDLITPEIRTTDLGRVISHYFLTEKTLLAWNALLLEENDRVLSFLADAEEFASLAIRAEDRAGLGLKNTDTEIDREVKIKILLDKHIQGKTARGHSLSIDQRYIVDNASRLLQGLSEYFEYKQRYPLAYRASFVKKQLARTTQRYGLLMMDVALSNKPNALLFSGFFTGTVYLRSRGAVVDISRIFSTKEYYLPTASKVAVSVTAIDKSMVFSGRVEILPVRRFAEDELWLVDEYTQQIAGYIVESAQAPPVVKAIEFKCPDQVAVVPLPSIAKEEQRAYTHLSVYEEIKRVWSASRERVAVVVPYVEDQAVLETKIRTLSLGEGLSFEPNPSQPTSSNGITTLAAQTILPWSICVSEVRGIRVLGALRDRAVGTYIFAGFSKHGVLYPRTLLQTLTKSKVVIYASPNESQYIRQYYL